MADQEKEGKIFHVEDDTDFTVRLNEVLQSRGSSIVLSATTVEQASSMIPDRLVEAGVNLSIIDGILPDGKGKEVAELIRAARLHIPIIALTSLESTWGDLNISKIDGPRKLFEAIATALCERPTRE